MRSKSLITFIILVNLTYLTGCNTHLGIVYNAIDGEPIGMSSVLIADKTGRVWTTTTDSNGRYFFDARRVGLAGGPHVVSILAPGFLIQTRSIGVYNWVQQDFALEIDFDTDDTDGDGVTNGNEVQFGTNPNDPDTDADGLTDSLETIVSAPFSPLALGTKPLRKDVIVEVDWPFNRPDARMPNSVISNVQKNFSQAPINNPDGTQGIHLIIDQGKYGGGNPIESPLFSASNGILLCEWFNDNTIDQVIQTGPTPTRSGLVFRMIVVPQISCGAFGAGEVSGHTSFIDSQHLEFGLLSPTVVSASVIHELGHNFGLTHGGDAKNACKPNYISVMNNNPILALLSGNNYSRGTRISLDESALYEPDGIGNGAIDWNKDGIIDTEFVSADVDNLQWMPQWLQDTLYSVAPIDFCPPNGIDVVPLSDHDDWNLIARSLSTLIGVAAASSQRNDTTASKQTWVLDTHTVLPQ